MLKPKQLNVELRLMSVINICGNVNEYQCRVRDLLRRVPPSFRQRGDRQGTR